MTVNVTGAILGGILSAPVALSPRFDRSVTDYVWRCSSGANLIVLRLSAAGKHQITVGSETAQTIVIDVSVQENEAVVITAPMSESQLAGTVDYWVRCLPHDFPVLQVERPGSPPEGWYLTGNLNSTVGGATYAMVLDSRGTPVWYRRTATSQALNVTALRDGSIAWAGLGAPFEDFNLTTTSTQWITAPLGPTDFHELQQMSNGHLLMLSNPLKGGVDLGDLNLPSNSVVLDCVVEEVDPRGNLVWSWRASDHIRYSESTHPIPVNVGGQLTYDPFHCNSIDVDPSSGDILVSMRQTDAVYRINRLTGAVLWKLGGNSVEGAGVQHLAIVGDPEGAFHAQHDARFQPDASISLYDDQSWNTSLPARGVVYRVNVNRSTANLVWSYASPDGKNSPATGSFRRLNHGTDNVIGWGNKPGPRFSEVDAGGHLMLSVSFPDGELAYRVSKLPEPALDHLLLRRTAGLPPAHLKVVPSISYIVPFEGPSSGGSKVGISGVGLRGLTAVTFGGIPAQSFDVVSDNQVLVTTPPGKGTVPILLTTLDGASSSSPINLLAGSTSDSMFQYGVGSWTANVNSVLTVSDNYSLSPPYSLRVMPTSPGFTSAFSGIYPTVEGAQISGGESVLTPEESDQVRAFLVFYDTNGSVVAIDQGAFVQSSTNSWTSIAIDGVVPVGAAGVRVGIDVASATSALYVDDASLTAGNTYTYVDE